MPPHAVWPAPRAKPLKAAHQHDDGGKHRRFAQPHQVRRDADGLGKPFHKLGKPHAQLGTRHQHAAQHAQQVGKHRQQRQGQQQGQQLGQHQHFQRRNADGAHGIDLLRHRHGAYLCGIGRARAPGNDDGRHQRRKLAQHRQAHQIGHKNIGPVAAQLVGPLVGHHHAQQKRQDADNGQRIPATAAQVEHDGPPADAHRVAHPARQRQGALAHKAQQRQSLRPGGACFFAHRFQHACPVEG